MFAYWMSAVPRIIVNYCFAQRPMDDAAAACSEQPSLNDIAHILSSLNLKSVVSLVPLRDDEVPEPVGTEKMVGYDRGLEANYIVGATKLDGKLMFLMAWKNSVNGEVDLLEATEVYKKSPQVAIKFFEKHFVCGLS